MGDITPAVSGFLSGEESKRLHQAYCHRVPKEEGRGQITFITPVVSGSLEWGGIKKGTQPV